MLSNIAVRARHEIANYLRLISSSPAFWFTINGDQTYGFALCKRLGMGIEDWYSTLVAAGLASINSSGKLIHEKKQWADYLQSHYFCKMDARSRPQFSEKKTVLHRHVDGTPIQKGDKRIKLLVIRIGCEQNSTPHSFLDQKDNEKKLVQTPPQSNLLRAQQRTFARTMVPMIMEASRENDRLYERIMSDNESKRSISPGQLKSTATISSEKLSKKSKTTADAELTNKGVEPPSKSPTFEAEYLATSLDEEISPSVDKENVEVPEAVSSLITKVANALGDCSDERFLDGLLLELLALRENEDKPSYTVSHETVRPRGEV